MFPAKLPSYVLARVHQVGIEFKIRDQLRGLDRPVEVYVPQRITLKKVCRHVRRRTEVVTPAFPIYVFVLVTCPTAYHTAFDSIWRLSPVYFRDELAIVPDKVIGELRAMEASGAFNAPDIAVGIGFKAGEIVLVVSGAFEGRGVVARDTGEGAKVPVEFPSGLKGKFSVHHVSRVDP
jgi:transcription antitermination factor NusG